MRRRKREYREGVNVRESETVRRRKRGYREGVNVRE